MPSQHLPDRGGLAAWHRLLGDDRRSRPRARAQGFPGCCEPSSTRSPGSRSACTPAICGIILGFVSVSLYEGFQPAADIVQTAPAQLIQLYEDTSRLPVAGPMENELRTYVVSVRLRELS